MRRSKPAPLTLETGDRAGVVACAAAMLAVEGSIVASGGLVEVAVVLAARARFRPEKARARARIEEEYIFDVKGELGFFGGNGD